MNYLGLDYGEAHIGVSIATTPLAEPLTTVSTKRAIQLIKDLITKYQIHEVVVGDCPKDFFRDLPLPVHQVDETLTSYDAREFLSHTSQTKRRELEHSVSATLILQSYLDSLSV